MRVVAASSVAKMNRITEETEVMAQKFSWGLGQVLGSTARWLGFKGLLSELCEPKTGIFWCCEAFQRLSSRYKEIDYQIAAYNAGSLQKRADGSIVNQKYIDKVLKLYTKEPKT